MEVLLLPLIVEIEKLELGDKRSAGDAVDEGAVGDIMGG